MSRSPHDALFQFTFQQLQHAIGLFQAILPAAVVEPIDWASLRLQGGCFVDKRLRRQQSDLLHVARIGGRSVLLYLLTEHKSRSER